MKAITYTLAMFLVFGCYHRNNTKGGNIQQSEILSHVWRSSCRMSNNKNLSITTEYLPGETAEVKFGLHPVSQHITFSGSGGTTELTSLPSITHSDSLQSAVIEVLDCIVTDAKCLHIGDELLYSLYGSSTIDPPHEFFGLLSSNDGWLWWYYGSPDEVYSEYGNIDSLVSVFGGNHLNDLSGMSSILPD